MKLPRFGMKNNLEKSGFRGKPDFCAFFRPLVHNSQQIFTKFGFTESSVKWCKKFWKKPDSKIFWIFSKMVSTRYFMIINCFSFFEIPIFKATASILLFGGKMKLRDHVRPDRSVNLQDGQWEECARSAHVHEFCIIYSLIAFLLSWSL